MAIRNLKVTVEGLEEAVKKSRELKQNIEQIRNQIWDLKILANSLKVETKISKQEDKP